MISLIKKISDKPGEHGKDFKKIKFHSDDNLPLYKILKINQIKKIYDLSLLVL